MTQGQVILNSKGKGDPVVIKTEVVERPNLTNFGARSSGLKGATEPLLRITMPRLEFMRERED